MKPTRREFLAVAAAFVFGIRREVFGVEKPVALPKPKETERLIESGNLIRLPRYDCQGVCAGWIVFHE